MPKTLAYVLVGRCLTAGEVGEYLGHDGAWFSRHRADLEAIGFPRPIAELDRWDRAAIDAWLDGLAEAGLTFRG